MTRTFKINLIRSHIKLVWLFLIITLSLVVYSLFSYTAHADTTNIFSGVLKDQNGNAIRGVLIELRDSQNNFVNEQTAADGSFSIGVNPGMYSLKVYTSSPVNQSGLGQFSLTQPLSTPSIDLTTNSIVQDLTLPIATVNFTLYNPQGYGTSRATVTAGVAQSNAASATLYPGAPESTPSGSWTSNSISPNSNGTGIFKTIVGTSYPTGAISIRWKDTGRYSSNDYPLTTVNGLNKIDLPNTPPPYKTFSGIFKDSTGVPVNSTTISLRDAYNNVVSGVTDSTGSFNILARPGMYSLSVVSSSATGLGFFGFEQPTANPSIDLSSNVTQNLTLPVGIVNFTAYGSQGSIAPYVKIVARGQSTIPVSLYPNGPSLTSTLSTFVSQKIFADYTGLGTFRSIVGTRYDGTDNQHGVCYDSTGGSLCNKTPFTVGTNVIIIGGQ